MSLWHGGPAIKGALVLPAVTAEHCRSGEPDGWVYVARNRGLALTYAVTAGGWLYEVEPVGEVEHDPGSILGSGESLRCREARIVRRFRPSRSESVRVLRAMGAVAS